MPDPQLPGFLCSALPPQRPLGRCSRLPSCLPSCLQPPASHPLLPLCPPEAPRSLFAWGAPPQPSRAPKDLPRPPEVLPVPSSSHHGWGSGGMNPFIQLACSLSTCPVPGHVPGPGNDHLGEPGSPAGISAFSQPGCCLPPGWTEGPLEGRTRVCPFCLPRHPVRGRQGAFCNNPWTKGMAATPGIHVGWGGGAETASGLPRPVSRPPPQGQLTPPCLPASRSVSMGWARRAAGPG